jgi:hypothetical protein
MVTVKNAHQRKSQDGKSFVTLEVTGDLELLQSQRTGRFYATAKKCFIACTLPMEQAKLFIGQQMPGKIVRVACEAYEFKVPETGEVISLCHTYEYQPEELPEVKIEKSDPVESDYIVDEVMSEIAFSSEPI